MASKESLFDVLKRKPWGLSALIAAAIASSLQTFLPLAFALFAALPFLVIAIYVAWRQRGIPGRPRGSYAPSARCTASATPWSPPHTTKVQPAPCHKPPNSMVIMRLA